MVFPCDIDISKGFDYLFSMDEHSSPVKLPRFGRGLSARLLLLTILFVLFSQFLFFAPSIVRYRATWLEQKLGEGHLAILAQRATRGIMLDPELEVQLLDIAGLQIVGLHTIDGRHLVLRGSSPAPVIAATFDLGDRNFIMNFADTMETLLQPRPRVVRIMGPSPRAKYASVEVVLNEGPLHQALIEYSWQFLRASFFISLVAAILLYGALQWLAIRPMRLLTLRMVRFRQNPEQARIEAPLSGRSDELGLAERELTEMQQELRQALQQKTRLAALGTAVSKINHDLRNILATARLITDRLVGSDDPQVRKAAPRLVDALDRAVAMCSNTMSFARETPILPVLSRFSLVDLHDELREDLSEYLKSEKEWLLDLGGVHEVVADRDQLHRVLFNLGENALQMGAHRVAIVARRLPDAKLLIDVKDDGAGLPPKALENLFIPFKGSARAGGTGLGLAIARESLRAMGGDLTLLETGSTGTVFRIELPDLVLSAEILPFRAA